MSDLDRLEQDLGKVPTRTLSDVRKAVEVSARNLKDGWQDAARAANPKHARGYPATISYETKTRIDGPSAVVGPEIGGAGSLGILEDAPGGVAAAPQRNWEKPLRDVESDLILGLGRAVGGILD